MLGYSPQKSSGASISHKTMIHIAHSPISTKFPLFPRNLWIPYFRKNYGFLLNLRFFSSPYFDQDAFMRQALQVLDAPAGTFLC